MEEEEGGGPGGAPGSEWQTEAEEESSLKSLVKIMKTNGDTVSRDGEENFICEALSPAVGWVGGGFGGVLRSLGTTEARKTPPPEKNVETKKNESAHCNNCSGSIIPTQGQLALSPPIPSDACQAPCRS